MNSSSLQTNLHGCNVATIAHLCWLSTEFTPVLGPTQPPVHWTLGLLQE